MNQSRKSPAITDDVTEKAAVRPQTSKESIRHGKRHRESKLQMSQPAWICDLSVDSNNNAALMTPGA